MLLSLKYQLIIEFKISELQLIESVLGSAQVACLSRRRSYLEFEQEPVVDHPSLEVVVVAELRVQQLM